MPKKISPLRRNILYFLSLFNYITLPIIVILFIVFILYDIPLKHIFGFLIVYSITKSLTVIFDSQSSHISNNIIPQKYIYISLGVVNIITLLFLTLLIERYELSEYRITIYISALLILNILFAEFSYHFIFRFMKTQSGAWLARTLLLMIGVGVGIFGMNFMKSSPPPTVPSTPKKTFSEVTGVISTVDPNVEEIPTTPENLSSSKTGDEATSQVAGNSPATRATDNPGNTTEVTGTLDTLGNGVVNGVRIDSIESVDGQATAVIKDGKIVVQVVQPTTNTGSASTVGWRIHSSVKRASAGGGLQGVVISPAQALPIPGTHANYQDIILTADGSSGIFFTIDGTEPSCDGKGLVDLVTDIKSINIKVISCFGGNKVRGPIASYLYDLKK